MRKFSEKTELRKWNREKFCEKKLNLVNLNEKIQRENRTQKIELRKVWRKNTERGKQNRENCDINSFASG